MKIGIFTFQRANNYGAVLQNFALLKSISNFDSELDVYTIDFRNEIIESEYENKIISKEKNVLKQIFHTVMNIIYFKHEKNLIISFDQFRRKYLNLTPPFVYDNLIDDKVGMDLYITGSDQVWNQKIVGEKYSSAYMLGFVKNSIKISYAASSGHSKNFNNKLMTLIDDLDGISVREEELQIYLSERISKPICCVVDPVFLLNVNEWNALLNQKRFLSSKYIFVYCIGDKFAEVSQIANKLAQEHSCKILYFDKRKRYGRNGINAYGIGPFEFVQAIRDAEFVVASSFHATAFSIIFNKKYVAVPRSDTGGRITELVNMVGQKKMCCNSYSDFLTSFNYEKCNTDELDKRIALSKKYLKSYFDLVSNNQKS